MAPRKRGFCLAGFLSDGSVRVDGRDRRPCEPDLRGMEIWSLDVTRRINVGFAEGWSTSTGALRDMTTGPKVRRDMTQFI